MAALTIPRPAGTIKRGAVNAWLRALRIPDPATLRRLGDNEVSEVLNRHGARRVVGPVVYERCIAEFGRRAVAERKARERKERQRARALAERTEFRTAIEALYLDAVRHCGGVLLNEAGHEAGVEEASLFYGSWPRARKYASWELLHSWGLESRRLTFAEFRRQSRDSRPE